ncbi:class I SAM-dependent methyltransferase [Pseudomonas tolaasii]|uniref:O-methyltransferase n=1 Tax=Pseudomonas tolaasii TaxID=29442 RepID=UPI0015A434E8|nr:class I SAM-dependent methyltransferase [Pseudomonas tolaasii]MBW1249240.1 class I SAM-dependent methyltransferase [Pseudomonas tolaasii]NVZ45759.1 class I SAM-dependent methyltransferase [Pseudomonas tolaasii]NWA49685.1 class I SAM-dependent methyltransferase [Pseudomonas tolaasii]WLH49341.1 class I SAM-dependent methyltransferase [Pseudomonas tolaasii]
MTTLTTAPLTALIERLYAKAGVATSDSLGAVSREERDRLMHSKTEYIELYTLLKDLWLPVSRDTGNLLYMLARSTRARAIVEFGTSFGLSTLFLAAALRDNGGGVVIGSEFEPAKIALAREHFIEGGVSDLIEIREGDALVSLASGLPESVDLLLLDGAKALYGDVLNLVEKHLRPGALVVADNTNYCPEYLEHVRSPQNGYLSVPFADDIELSIRLG